MMRQRAMLLAGFLLLILVGTLGYRQWAGTHTTNPPVQAAALHTRVSDHWKALKDIGPRTLGSAGHQQALTYLQAQFRALGYQVETTTFDIPQMHDAGSVIIAGSERFPASALEGSGPGDQSGPLVDLRRASSTSDISNASVSGKIVLLSCQPGRLMAMIDQVFQGGGFGVILADTCPAQALEQGDGTPLPVVVLSESAAQRLARVSGRTVEVTAHVVKSTGQGTNLVAFRNPAGPNVLLTAPFAPHVGSLEADAGISGSLTLLDTARRAANTPLADQLWFAVLDGDVNGHAGEETFVAGHRYVLRPTRAALMLRRVGLGTATLQLNGHADLLKVARTTGQSVAAQVVPPGDERSALNRWQVRVMHLSRAGALRSSKDETLDLNRVTDTSAFIMRFVPKLLVQPWSPPPICDGIGKQDKGC